MTLAFDAATRMPPGAGSSGGTPLSDTHTPVGTPRAVIFLTADMGNVDQQSTVTYGGVPMTEVSASPQIQSAGSEFGTVYCYFLGSGIPTGAQSVVRTRLTPFDAQVSVCITLTAASDTAVIDSSGTAAASGADPSVSLSTDRDTFVAGVLWSGQNAVTGIAAGAGQTSINETDFGSETSGYSYLTAIQSAGTINYGWTMADEERALLAVAVGEDVTGGPAEIDAIGELAVTATGAHTGVGALSAIGEVSGTGTGPDRSGASSISAIGQLSATASGAHTGTAAISAGGRLAIPLVYESFNRIIAPGKAGRVHHEIEYRGETYHPNVDSWQAEEEAPGGFGPATGRISDRVYKAHRDVFLAGANWYTFLEDGTCIHAGRMLEPDTAHGEIQLSDRGASRLADREVGPVLYQTHVGSELTRWFADTDEWRVSFPALSHSGTGGGQNIAFDRTPNTTGSQGGAQVNIPFFGREPAFMRFKMQGNRYSLMTIQTRLRQRDADPNSSHELDMSTQFHEHFHFQFELGETDEYVEVDLRLDDSALPNPNSSVFTNVGVGADADLGGYTGVGDIITIEVEDGTGMTGASESTVLLMNIEVNGTAVGDKEAFSAHDLVADIAALIGIRYTQIEGGSFNVLPYELPPGTPATEALDWASLVSGKRWRIRHNGNYPVLEFGSYHEHRWGLASPWAPFDAIPQERFDAVAIPYEYPSTQGQLTDQMILKLKDSPLDRRNIYWELALQDPAHNQDQARAIAGRVAEELVRKRNAGSFAAASIIGPDGLEHSAHHVNAGDTLFPMREDEPGRLHIGRLTRYDDHVEGEFDGENRALARMLARREKKVARRKG